MAILVDTTTKVVVSGMTGREGRFHSLRNREYGTHVVAGVRALYADSNRDVAALLLGPSLASHQFGDGSLMGPFGRAVGAVLNWGLGLVGYLVQGPLMEAGGRYPQTDSILPALWMPRFSLAYKVGEKNVIKGGYGMYYDTLNARDWTPNQDGYNVTTTNQLSNDFGQTFALGDPKNGILPLVNARHASFLYNEVPGISIPDETRTRMEKAGEDGQRVGVELAVALIESVKGWAQGVYLMPQFSRYDLVAEIIEACKTVDK